MKLLPCAVTAVAGLAASCFGQSWMFTINAAQQVPANGSQGVGTGTVNYFADTNVLAWEIAWSGLLGVPTAMHFHFGAPGQNGMHAVHIEEFTASTTGMASGSDQSVAPEVVSALMAGNVYVNIHTTAFPSGEIRGQVVPAPATTGALALGVLAAAHRRRR